MNVFKRWLETWGPDTPQPANACPFTWEQVQENYRMGFRAGRLSMIKDMRSALLLAETKTINIEIEKCTPKDYAE